MWKVKQDIQIRNGSIDARAWALSESEVISELNEENVSINPSDLSLVCLFNE